MDETTVLSKLEQDEVNINRHANIIFQQQSILAGLAAQITAMNNNVSLLNHNIRQTCDRLDKMALEGHHVRIEALEDWRKETGSRLDKFLLGYTDEIATLRSKVLMAEERVEDLHEWRKTFWHRVLMSATAVSGVMIALWNWMKVR